LSTITSGRSIIFDLENSIWMTKSARRSILAGLDQQAAERPDDRAILSLSFRLP
jgi:hypothetical protein